MFAKELKYSLFRNRFIFFTRRSIVSTAIRSSVKTTSEKSTVRKDVESYRPLTENEIQKIINLDNIHIVTKFQQKQPQRQALLKNFFIGKIDTELFSYPEVMEVKDFNVMVHDIKPVTSYFENIARTPAELRFRDVSNQMVLDFQFMKLFGASIHQRFGGSGLFKSEMNYASESEANDIKSFLVLAGHRLAVEAISDHGNVSHHSQYLMEMARGELIGAICLPDPLNKNDKNRVKVSTTSDGDYVLNGSKSFTICSQHANVLVVVAEKSDELKNEYERDEDSDEEDFFDAYLTIVLDSKSSGITMIDENDAIGCNDVPFKTIHFSNVRVGKDQILTEGIDDRRTSQKLIASSRLQESTLNMIQSKNILNQLIEFCIRAECNGEKMRDILYVRHNLAKLGCNIYGLESMIYLNAGIIDRYDNPKVELECAITKAYSHDILQNLTQLAVSLIGSPITIAEHKIDLDIMNAVQLQRRETSRGLKSHVGREGLQHAMDFFGDRASNYKDSIWSKLGLSSRTVEDFQQKYFLGDYVHPTLIEAATDLEFSILRLQCCAEMLLNRYGGSVSEREAEIEDLGEIVMQNYVMFASLGRASRAYCIGSRYSVYETVAAGCLVAYTRNIFKKSLDIKNNKNGIQNVQRTIVENALKQHRKQLDPIPFVLQSGVLQKTVK